MPKAGRTCAMVLCLAAIAAGPWGCGGGGGGGGADGDGGDNGGDGGSKTAAPAFSLPDTGQVNSYTDTWGEDSDYPTNPPSYMDNGDGTVTDNVTGLMWQQEDDDTEKTWEEAGTYCENLSLGGYADWRLPSRMELLGIVNYGRHSPAINTAYFHNTKSSYYRTSTPLAYGESFAWGVSFTSGGTYGFYMTGSDYVRCVRGDGYPEQGFSDNGNDTVADNVTGRMWQKTESDAMSWESALAYCEGLSLGGYDDWRLPDVKELSSLVDDTRFSPSINPVFSGAHSLCYWSSTTNAAVSTSAWYVFLNNGYTDTDPSDKTFYSYYARCVRGGG